MREEILLRQRGKTLSVKDMYADLEKIEARGKRKKEKGKGLFSSFGKKDEPEQEAAEPPKAPEPPQPEPVKAQPQVQQPPPQPIPAPPPEKESPPQPAESDWKPPTGGKLKKAEEELLAYKKWLNKGYKSGILTKEQCTDMVRVKEIELGLRPPE